MLDILLLALQIVTLVLLFLFIWWVVRSARTDLDRSVGAAQRSPPVAEWDGHGAGRQSGGYAPPPSPRAGPVQMAAGVAVADWAARPESPAPTDRPQDAGPDPGVGETDADLSPGSDAAAASVVAASAVADDETPGQAADGGSGAAAGAVVSGTPRLLVERSPVLDEGTEIPLGRWLGIGRSPGSDLSLNDPFVSATHARVGRRGGECFVEDLGSTNGTYVNERRVTEERLRSGARLRIGETVFRFEE